MTQSGGSMSSSKKACCCHRLPWFVPVIAIFCVIAIFAAIIVATKIETSSRDLPWKQALIMGNGFRIEPQKVIIPILRRCDGPKLEIAFFSAEDNQIPAIYSTPNQCGSSLSSFFGDQTTEVVINIINTNSKSIHALVMAEDFVDTTILNRMEDNSSFFEEPQLVTFSICVLPKFRYDGKIEVEEYASIPEMAAFFESWIYYGAVEFIIYDLFSPQNESLNQVYDLYKDVKIIKPFETDKSLIQEKFLDGNLFYSYDCLYRTRHQSTFAVLTTFEDIPIVQTSTTLLNVFSLVNRQAVSQAGTVYSLSNGKTNEVTTTIFNPLDVDSFDKNNNIINKTAIVTPIPIPTELAETFTVIQLGSVLFQQPNNSAMNQIFHAWTQNYQFRVQNNLVNQTKHKHQDKKH